MNTIVWEQSAARDQHYAPQFVLRNFAIDPEKKKVTTVGKHGPIAVWSERSIESIGYERDFYVHMRNGVPVCVEDRINEHIETPISKSDTWAKIVAGRADLLDRTDKPILYALIRHLEARNPHYLQTAMELMRLACSDKGDIPFTEEEREMYAFFRSRPDLLRANFNAMSASLKWTAENFSRAGISIIRSPIPLRTSTTPVVAKRTLEHPALYLPLPGMVPYQLVLTLNKRTIAMLVLAGFDDAFMNTEITVEMARAFNRYFVLQFGHFERVRHLITDRDDLIADMTWAQYDLVRDEGRKIVFRRRPADMPPTT
jgi:hypothetical protein